MTDNGVADFPTRSDPQPRIFQGIGMKVEGCEGSVFLASLSITTQEIDPAPEPLLTFQALIGQQAASLLGIKPIDACDLCDGGGR